MRRASHRGFTLLELMIVMVIVGVLMTYLLFSGGDLWQSTKVKEGRQRLSVLASLIEGFRTAEGQYPDDRLDPEVAANQVNASAEALYLALFDADYSGSQPDQDWLVNTDGDESRKQVSSLPTRELFEIGDPWGNPVVYFESLHYGDEVVVLAGVEEEFEEQRVSARRHPTTGGWQGQGQFQLLSAGPDGLFGTEDDINYSGG